jgi:hypothetical protein
MILLNKKWERVSRNVIEKRLKKCIEVILSSDSKLSKKHTSVSMLGSFDQSSNVKVLHAYMLRPVGISAEKGMIEFEATGDSSFGMWIDYVGYVPISRTYLAPEFYISEETHYKLWIDNELSLRILDIEEYHTMATTRTLHSKAGNHQSSLIHGSEIVGIVQYTVKSQADALISSIQRVFLDPFLIKIVPLSL